VNSSIKTIIFWAVLICFAVLLWTVLHGHPGKETATLNFTEFMHQVNEGNVKSVQINGTEVKGDFTNKNASFQTLIHRKANRWIRRSKSNSPLSLACSL